MKIQIQDKLYVETDERQFILKEYTGNFSTDKNGNRYETYKVHGYFTRLEHLYNKVLHLKIHKSNAKSFQELIDEVTSFKEFLNERLNDLRVEES